MRRGDCLADIDRVDEIVGEGRSRLDAFLLDLVGEHHVEFGRLAIDFLLRRRVDQRIGDHGAHIRQRGLPVAGERGKGHEGRIDRARDVVLLDLRVKEAATAARTRFEPAVDDRLGNRIEQQALVIDDGVLHLPPRAHDSIGQAARQIRLHPDGEFANRRRHAGGRHGIGGCDRIAEIGRDTGLAGALPVTEPLFHQPRQHHRIGIPGDDDGGVLGPVPAVIERLHALAPRADERRVGADRIPHGKALSGKEGLAGEIGHALPRPAALALFGEDDRAFSGDVGIVQHRLADHAREQLEAFGQLGIADVGNVELVDRVGRRGLGIGIAAEGRAEPLPGGNRLGLPEILALAEQHMFEQVGKALLAVGLVHRTCIDPHPDRDLARRHPVAAHGIAQAVLHLAEQPLLVRRNVRAAIEPGHGIAGLQRLGRRHRRSGGRDLGRGRVGLLREQRLDQHKRSKNKSESAGGAGERRHGMAYRAAKCEAIVNARAALRQRPAQGSGALEIGQNRS